MPDIAYARYTASNDRDIVLFRIGMRFNGIRGIANALRMFVKMPQMLAELERDKALGLLSYDVALSLPVITVTQFWRSFEDLERYATARERKHAPAWAWFNKLGRSGRGAGIWHETYRLQAHTYEAIYVNMPSFGLARATEFRPLLPAEHRAAVRAGMRAATGSEP